MRANTATSCPNGPYLTSAGWWPVERYETAKRGIVYYRAADDSLKTRELPEGIQLFASKPGLTYNCGAEPLDPTKVQTTPPYNCTTNWATHLRFPACWNGWQLKHNPASPAAVYGSSRTSCPDSHPIRLVEVTFTITHPNSDGKVPNPLKVSCGSGTWCDYTHMHADYFFAAQDEVNVDVDLDGDGKVELKDADGNGAYEPWLAHGDSEQALVDLCVREAPSELAYNNARCRADGLLAPHITALKSYYG